MIKFQQVRIKEYIEKTKYWLKRHSEYMDKLADINVAEKQEIINEFGKSIGYWDDYKAKYPEKVKERQEQRDKLKEEYGEYTSYFNCPYYCLATNKKELDELYNIYYKDSNRGEGSSYQHNLKSIKEMKGRLYQDDCNPETYGRFIGIAFFIDQDYYCLKDKRGNVALVLNVSPFNVWDHKSYRIVTNGQDYF